MDFVRESLLGLAQILSSNCFGSIYEVENGGYHSLAARLNSRFLADRIEWVEL